jgi:hypothetical protein
MHLDHFRSEPGKTECLEAIWSEGKSCKGCWVECYRKGWPKKQVDADNARLVAEYHSSWPPSPSVGA